MDKLQGKALGLAFSPFLIYFQGLWVLYCRALWRQLTLFFMIKLVNLRAQLRIIPIL